MAGRYSKQELKEMLHRSAFRLVALEGIESLTVRKVSGGCGLSDPYIYQCYSDMTELLTDAFLKIDREIADLVAEIIKKQLQSGDFPIEESCWALWSAYWNFLLTDPDKIIFYWRFYQSAYYSEDLLTARRRSFRVFINYVNTISRKLGLDKRGNINAVISCVIDDTASAAVKIHLGYLKKSDFPTRVIYGSAFSYLLRLAGIDVWENLNNEHDSEVGA